MKNMKTIKSLLYLLVAAGALAVVGCTKDETYTKGGDTDGERIYIDNSVEVFYVKTAEEKQEEEAQLAKLSRGLKQNIESSDDDKSVTINVCRLNSKLATYTTTIELTLPSDSYQLFELPAGATQSGAGSGTVTYSFEVSFDEGADKAPFEIGFDIDQLESNVEYEMTATVADDGNTTNYGASSFDFAICHKTELTFPYKEIGKISLSEDAYGFGPYSDIIIEIDENDYKAWKEDKKDMPYIRYRIPKYMYQIVAAAVEAGDASEDDLALFENCNDVLFNLTTDYDFIYDYDNKTYALPLDKDITAGGKNYLYAAMGLDSSSGTLVTTIYDGYYTFNQTLRGGWYFYPGECSVTRESNVFNIMLMLADMDSTSLYGAYLNLNFAWDTNDMEDDWSNYFKTDYNNSIDYVKAKGSGTFSSTAFSIEDEPQTWAQDLYVGFDNTSGQQVYYLPNVYQTVTSEENEYGLAVLVNGSSVTLASAQPLGMQWNGNEISAQQSESIASSVEYAEDGSVKKLTLGVAFVLPNGNVMADYTETYEFNSSAAGVEAFYGTYTQAAYEIYSPYFGEDGKTPIAPQPSPISSTVTISQAVDSSNQPIAGKVFINGMIPVDYLDPEAGITDGRLVGEYDAVSNSIIIKAQYFYKPVWKGLFKDPTIDGYPYFQPGVGSFGAYNTDNGPTYISELGAKSEACALYMGEDGNLTLGFSTKDASGNNANCYAIELCYFDGTEFVNAGELNATYGDADHVITFTKTTSSTTSVKASAASASKAKQQLITKTSAQPAAQYVFPQLGKSINPEQLGR